MKYCCTFSPLPAPIHVLIHPGPSTSSTSLQNLPTSGALSPSLTPPTKTRNAHSGPAERSPSALHRLTNTVSNLLGRDSSNPPSPAVAGVSNTVSGSGASASSSTGGGGDRVAVARQDSGGGIGGMVGEGGIGSLVEKLSGGGSNGGSSSSGLFGKLRRYMPQQQQMQRQRTEEGPAGDRALTGSAVYAAATPAHAAGSTLSHDGCSYQSPQGSVQLLYGHPLNSPLGECLGFAADLPTQL